MTATTRLTTSSSIFCITDNESTFHGDRKTHWPCDISEESTATPWKLQCKNLRENKITTLHRFTPPHLQQCTTPEHGHETVTQKLNTFCRLTLGFVNIKNRDLTHLAHHTKQYQTHNTMCHYKGINDLLNQVFVSSVQQKQYTVLCGSPDLWDTVRSQAHFSTVTCWVGKVENITSAQQTLAIS